MAEVLNIEERSPLLTADFKVLMAVLLTSGGNVVPISTVEMETCVIRDGAIVEPGRALNVSLGEGDYLLVLAQGSMVESSRLDLVRALLFRSDGGSVRLFTGYYGNRNEAEGWGMWRFPLVFDILSLSAELTGDNYPTSLGQVSGASIGKNHIQ